MGRFASTAELYAQFRPPYPAEFFRTVARKLKLTKQHSLIDLGTGPGLLALGFAPHVGAVTAVDPEPAMLAAARAAVARSGYEVRLIEGRAEDLASDIGPFDLVTIGRALHWMDRAVFGPLFTRLIAPGGALVICGSSSARDHSNPWLDSYDSARRAWSDEMLWSQRGKGEETQRELVAVLERLGFSVADVIRVKTTHEVSISDLAQRVLTFSSSSPAVLGDRVDALLADVEARLLPFSRDGRITETLVSTADVIRR
ncbi:MAG: class I SAM-dependent methyltransferase [Bradyrhizobium sp.]|nr:class I SAM-dependent methyltransferase [Bradyrhizobium sp.]